MNVFAKSSKKKYFVASPTRLKFVGGLKKKIIKKSANHANNVTKYNTIYFN